MTKKLIVLDTETTGLEVDQGHRIVEVGAVALEVTVVPSRAVGAVVGGALQPLELVGGAVVVTPGVALVVTVAAGSYTPCSLVSRDSMPLWMR